MARVMPRSNVWGAFTAVGFNSTGCMIKDARAFLFRVVKAGVVDHEPIKCKSKAGQGTPNAVCGDDAGNATMCGVVLLATHARVAVTIITILY